MYYEEMNPELKSSFLKILTNSANLTDRSQLPDFGLKARNLLSENQLTKLQKIREKHLSKHSQREQFQKD